jgi:hypothetical protein
VQLLTATAYHAGDKVAISSAVRQVVLGFFLATAMATAMLEAMEIARGTPLSVETASGEVVIMRALRPPEQGKDFRVVWVCTTEEYNRAEAVGEEPRGVPWPYSAIRSIGA